MRNFTLLFPLFFAIQLYSQSYQTDSIVTKEIFFIDQSETISKQFNQYLGKVIYVDIWATWCAPCIASFKYKKDLDEFFESNDIVFLSLCVDKVKYINNWRNLIYKHSVKGYHVFVDYETLDDYKTDLEISRRNKKFFGRGFPSYMIVDKDGKIVNTEALGPHHREKLIQQLRTYVN